MAESVDSVLQQLNSKERQVLDTCLDECEKENVSPAKKSRIDKYKCNICDKVIKRSDNYRRHAAGHLRQEHRCTTCDKSFTRKYTLQQHVKNKHQSASTIYSQASTASPTQTGGGQLNEENQEISCSSQSSLNGAANVKTFYPSNNSEMDLLVFFTNMKGSVADYLQKQKQNLLNLKWFTCVQVELQKTDADGNKMSTRPHFRSASYIYMNEEDFPEHDVNEAFQKMFNSFEKYLREGSNWTLEKVVKLEISTAVYSPLKGSSYIPLPSSIKNRGQIVNVINDDDRCFLWSVLAAIHPALHFPECISHYKPFEHELNTKDLQFPVPISQVHKFEKSNGLSINVFGFENKEIFPLYVTKVRNPNHVIDLLFLKQGKVSHYCLIKDLNTFLFRTKSSHRKTYFCHFCLHGFIRQDLLDAHVEYCSKHDPQRVELPEEKVLEFKDFEKQLKVPFVIYADFETYAQKMDTCSPDPQKSSTTVNTKFEPCGFGYQVVCVDDRYTKPPVVYRGSNVSKTFLERIIEEEKQIRDILKNVVPLSMTPENERDFRTRTLCYLCRKPLNDEDRVRHHDHVTGAYYGPCHSKCNLACKQATFVPVIFHNLKGFDSHIICESIGHFKEHEIKCIPNNMEKYISFSLGNLRFIDSFQFMNQSLEQLTKNLVQEGMDRFKHFSREFTDPYQAQLLLRKGVYPYEFVDCESKFSETILPSKQSFYSQLSKSHISDSDYEHARLVWKELNVKNLGEYHDLYLKTDVLLLADVYENFRSTCMSHYQLDPAHFYTSPGLSWSSALKMTGVQLELLADLDMYLFLENGIRGGISMISNKHSRANNPYLETHDSEKPNKYIMYVDCNNLYGKAMMEPLPTGGFRWLSDVEMQQFSISDVSADGTMGYVLEVDLEYPTELHCKHSDYPLAPERKIVSDEMLSPYSKQLWQKLHPNAKHSNESLHGRVKTPKLVPTLENKSKYICHYRNLQLYLQLGMKITKIHKILEFQQSPWLKQYIDFNSAKRKEAKNDFERDFFKLMNNAVFGKTMENVRNRVDISLAHHEKKFKKLVSKPSFERFKIFNEHLVGVENAKVKLFLNKPVYVGQAILDLSKVIMYDFFYNYLKPKYGNKVKLLFTDTDSLCVEIETEDVYNDMYADRHWFDFSNYPVDHRCYDTTNKKVPGLFKDEFGGKIVVEFVGLKPKLYSFAYGLNESKQTAKGIKKQTIKKDLRHDMYRDCLLQHKTAMCQMNCIRSEKHQLHVETVNKQGLSPFCDKRYLLSNYCDTLAFGHFKIKNNYLNS